jgi:hypothetical protein
MSERNPLTRTLLSAILCGANHRQHRALIAAVVHRGGPHMKDWQPTPALGVIPAGGRRFCLLS